MEELKKFEVVVGAGGVRTGLVHQVYTKVVYLTIVVQCDVVQADSEVFHPRGPGIKGCTKSTIYHTSLLLYQWFSFELSFVLFLCYEILFLNVVLFKFKRKNNCIIDRQVICKNKKKIKM